ncbi:Hypothetical Protein RSKD131_3828 [Cereibacter sphaeroides KD131]|nr:Hypothetical Protein RSKD131_3828 [Cereibacter sphaeroides KD131]
MLLAKLIAAEVVEGKAKRCDLGSDDGVLVRRHQPCRRSASECQKQYGEQCDYNMP